MDPILLYAAGHRRSPVTMPGYHRGRPPRNKGLRYPADPPTIDEIIAVLRAAGDGRGADRLRALVVLLWRVGLRISDALDLAESDLDRFTGGILIRRGKGGKRRVVGMDRWGWQQLEPWLEIRAGLPAGNLLCVIPGPTAGRHWEAAAARKQLTRAAATAGVRRRFAPHQLRHAHAVEMAHEGIPLVVIQRQLGHSNLGITSIYLQGIDSAENRHRPRPTRPDDLRQQRTQHGAVTPTLRTLAGGCGSLPRTRRPAERRPGASATQVRSPRSGRDESGAAASRTGPRRFRRCRGHGPLDCAMR